MPKSVFTDAYQALLTTLVAARKRSGLTQVQLSEALGKPQPFISNIERGIRRVDLIEFVVIARAMGADPKELFAQVMKKLPKSIDI
ncbi:MAG: helix-turn-helix transcriptional regulator [Hyphomonadaceae bacterium]|nr:helix-turn-helix transcriptional regulator [Hyphomonadaceae bacterium]